MPVDSLLQTMAIPTVSDLYAKYDILNSETSTKEEKDTAYRSILMGTKGDDKGKRLACQFIARFSKQFDNLKEESFNCILDLCDDEDSKIRKQAIHDLLQFCKRIPSFVPRVADVFMQMFQTDDSSELHLLSMALSQLLHTEPKPTLAGVFNQLLTVTPDNPRDHILKFLVERLKTIPEDKMTTEVEDFVAEQANKVLRDVSEEEFPLLISILSSLKCMSTVPGRQKLVSIITDQALQACPEFNPTDPACVAQVRESGKQAALCVSKNVHARELYTYFLAKVMPKLREIPESLNDDRLALLRVTAELSIMQGSVLTTASVDELEQYLDFTLDALMLLLPDLPNVTLNSETTSGNSTTATISDDAVHTSCLNLTELECLLCVACQLGRVRPQFFGGYTSEEERETPAVQLGVSRLRLLRPRLQYLSQKAQEHAHLLANDLPENGQTEDTKNKLIAHRRATNIQILVRSFFHNPPMFKHTIVLSWTQSLIVASTGAKHSSPLSGLTDHSGTLPTKVRREQPRYTPPVGQWSRGNQYVGRQPGFQGNKRPFRNRSRDW